MDDKLILNTMLTLSKNMSTILFWGSIESCNKKVLDIFRDGLDEYLDIQGDLFNLMKELGYYEIKDTRQENIEEVSNKYKEC